MRVYKDFYVEDVLELLEQASQNNHLGNECVDSDLASLLYDFMEMSNNEEITEDEIYDYIRFDMEIQSTEEVKENYKHLFDKYAFENGDDITSEDLEYFLSYHTTYIGNYEVNDITYHVFSQF
jgi:tRNA U34 5-carboxymethylaminomethyl modifying GTPase MnmE/TrmE